MLNEFRVRLQGIGGLREVVIDKFALRLARRKALELAAWIVWVADPKGEEFDEIMRQIEES